MFVKRSLADISGLGLCPVCRKNLLDALAAAGVIVDYERGRWKYPVSHEAKALAAFNQWREERRHNHDQNNLDRTGDK